MTACAFPKDFMWGAATSPHQTEGSNVLSNWWAMEHSPQWPMEASGDAVDHYHRYGEDIGLLAGAGLNTYRFGIEWARIEPCEGEFSRAELLHYRAMIDDCLAAGVAPVVTLNHFTTPAWFSRAGGWSGEHALDLWSRYVDTASDILHGVSVITTINEPNMLAMLSKAALTGGGNGAVSRIPNPDESLGDRLIAAHRRAYDIVKQRHPESSVGWSVANQALVPEPGCEDLAARISWKVEGKFLEAAKGDDYVGVQSYTSQTVDAKGIRPHNPSPDNTLNGWAYRPDALGIAVRQTWKTAEGTPILVTENGIASDDDTRRISYTADALRGLAKAMDDGIRVLGYIHWSLLDNYEWGSWRPTFGLIGVDRATFKRTPKPSLYWLGAVARNRCL